MIPVRLARPSSNASVTSNHGPRMILAPVRFLARKAEWSARRYFTSVLFLWLHQATGPVRLDTTVHLWLDRIIRSARTGVVRAPLGNLQYFSYHTGPVRGPCGTRNGAVRHTYGQVRELTQPEFAKLPHGRRMWPYGARTDRLRPPHGLFMISKPVRSP